MDISFEWHRIFRWLGVTQLGQVYSRRAFPCFDEPQMKATYNIILGRKTSWKAVANTPLLVTVPMWDILHDSTSSKRLLNKSDQFSDWRLEMVFHSIERASPDTYGTCSRRPSSCRRTTSLSSSRKWITLWPTKLLMASLMVSGLDRRLLIKQREWITSTWPLFKSQLNSVS